mgnify:CR=1 FL=1
MKLDVTTLDGGQAGSVELSDSIFGLEPRADLIQRMVLWQLAKRQAGTHKVKGRAEIWRTGKKMYKQKGTGGARHGSARVPQFRGGGRAFGPVVRSHEHDLNKKVRKLALKAALSAKMFAVLSTGFEVQLARLPEDEDAEAGVDIFAQPPGKRISNLTVLSGGERSMTSVALLFALLSVNPAPVVVLDEVDAALDEANVGRFVDTLKELTERSQFIVITHNRRSVEAADTIYGVSMGDESTSQVLSLSVADLPRAS